MSETRAGLSGLWARGAGTGVGRSRSAAAPRERGERSEHGGQVLPPLSQVSNSLILIAAKALAMGLGFVFWVMAARLFSPHEVGLAAGVVSAMMLCTQLALLGLGSAFITHFPQLDRCPAALLNTSLGLVVAFALLWAGLFLLFASGAFSELDTVVRRSAFATMFVAAAVFGTLGILFDQIATALRRADQALARNVAFGAATVLVLGSLAVTTRPHSAEAIFLPWAVAGLAGSIIGIRQLRRALPHYRPRPAIDRALARALIRVGIPNYALTLSERAPGLILPLLVAELLSPAANATWFTVWMMAWAVYIVPIQVGMTIFAEVSHDASALRKSVRRGVLASLAVGTFAALLLGGGAEIALSILGDHYAEDGVAPLRVLLLALIPLTFVQAYFSACRARGSLAEATAAGWISGLVSVVAAALVAQEHGLVGIAVTWVVVQFAAGSWSLWRLRAAGLEAASDGEPRPAPPPARALGFESTAP